MVAAFQYRPKFVDIRAGKPEPGAEEFRAEPVARACDHMGCIREGAHRAPKSRQLEGQFWYFCLEHAAEYNRRWDYFADMSEEEKQAYAEDALTGHRPTWSFRADKRDRLSAAYRNFQGGKRSDPFNIFGEGRGGGSAAPAPRERRLPRLQRMALEALSLDETADGPAIRARYAELIKRFHPDSNGGDRAHENQLNRVIRAYQTLKAAGLA